MPRLFVAVKPPAWIREQLLSLCHGIDSARWVTQIQVHLTLRFIGSVTEADTEHLARLLTEVAKPAFSIALSGVGTFPRASARKPPRVLWVGVTPEEPLLELKRQIDESLGPDPEEARRFQPHFTLARFKAGPPRAQLEAFLARHATLSSPLFEVSSFALFESDTLPSGARHQVRQSVSLRGVLP